MKKYYPRIIDSILKEKLNYVSGVYLKGPKWCGKSTSSKQICESFIDLGDSSDGNNYIELAKTAPFITLKGKTPRLIDEWQLVPNIWNAVKTEIDKRNRPGQFIMTGSATPIDDESRHPGTGRISILNMYPMSLYESNDSNGKVSLSDLLNISGINIDGVESLLTFEDYAYLICRGGWPSTLFMSPQQSIKVANDYIETLCDEEISRTVKLPNNPRLVKLLLKSYARNVSTIDSYASIFKDVKSQYGDISDQMLKNYLVALERLMIIDEIEAWNPNLRSKTVIRTSKKKCLVDPSLAAASLNASPQTLEKDIRTMGLLFENLCLRDLKIYSSVLGGYVNHYRDNYGLECDAVIHFDNGKYMLLEIKLGSQMIDEAAKNLLKLNQLIMEKGITPPTTLVIITASKYAYTREDGIHIIPIGCLKN